MGGSDRGADRDWNIVGCYAVSTGEWVPNLGWECCNYLLIIQIKYFKFERVNLCVCLGIVFILTVPRSFAQPTLNVNGKMERGKWCNV